MQKFTLVFVMVVAVVLPVHAQDDGIIVWLTGGNIDTAVLQEAADVWTEASGIPVTVQTLSWGNRTEEALDAIERGGGADIFIGGLTELIFLGEQGGMVALDETFGAEVEALHAASNPRLVEAIVGYDSPVYAVPYNQNVYLMYYYTPMLEEAGIERIPETWDEFTTALEMLADAGLGGGGIGWGGGEWLSFHNFLLQAGGSWYTADCSAAAINSDAGITALEFYTSLYDEYGFPIEQVEPGDKFSTQERAFIISGEWYASGIDANFPEIAGEWGVAPLPAGPGGANTAFIGGRAAGIFSFSDNQQAAWAFLKWLSTPQAGELLTTNTWAQNGIYLPAYTTSYEFIRGGADFSETVINQLGSIAGPPNCPGWEESQGEMNRLIQEVLADGDIDTVLTEMETILNDALTREAS